MQVSSNQRHQFLLPRPPDDTGIGTSQPRTRRLLLVPNNFKDCPDDVRCASVRGGVATKVVSTASCTPPKSGSPSATISSLRAVGMGRSTSLTIMLTMTLAPPPQQIRGAALSTANPRRPGGQTVQEDGHMNTCEQRGREGDGDDAREAPETSAKRFGSTKLAEAAQHATPQMSALDVASTNAHECLVLLLKLPRVATRCAPHPVLGLVVHIVVWWPSPIWQSWQRRRGINPGTPVSSTAALEAAINDGFPSWCNKSKMVPATSECRPLIMGNESASWDLCASRSATPALPATKEATPLLGWCCPTLNSEAWPNIATTFCYDIQRNSERSRDAPLSASSLLQHQRSVATKPKMTGRLTLLASSHAVCGVSLLSPSPGHIFWVGQGGAEHSDALHFHSALFWCHTLQHIACWGAFTCCTPNSNVATSGLGW